MLGNGGRAGALAVLLLSLASTTAPALARDSAHVAGAGGGSYPAGATFNGLPLAGMRFGFGIEIVDDGSADGAFETTLIAQSGGGPPQFITIDGTATTGAIGATGQAMFSGASTVDMGDGTDPRHGVPFTMMIATDAQGHGQMTLTVDTTGLPAATVEKGGVTVRACDPPEVKGLVFTDDRTLGWSPSGPASTYNLYRGSIVSGAWTYDQTCLAYGMPGPGANDAAEPSSGRAYYYLVTGKNACGEGPLGQTSDGRPQPNGSPCP